MKFLPFNGWTSDDPSDLDGRLDTTVELGSTHCDGDNLAGFGTSSRVTIGSTIG